MRRGFFIPLPDHSRVQTRMPSNLWQLDSTTAHLSLGGVAATLTLNRPALGLHDWLIDGTRLLGFHTLAVAWPRPALVDRSYEDCYARDGDLVVTYSEQGEPPLRTQVYWAQFQRCQTARLRRWNCCWPCRRVSGKAPQTSRPRASLLASQAFQLIDLENGRFESLIPWPERTPESQSERAPCFLFRLPGGQYSYAEMSEPGPREITDWDGWLAGVDLRFRLEHRLFGDQLEKGVILKGRIGGVLLPRAGDFAAAARYYQAFLNAPLPLTT